MIKTFSMHTQHVIKSLKQFMTPQASANIKYREKKNSWKKQELLRTKLKESTTKRKTILSDKREN
jgi:hypothetical protein